MFRGFLQVICSLYSEFLWSKECFRQVPSSPFVSPFSSPFCVLVTSYQNKCNLLIHRVVTCTIVFDMNRSIFYWVMFSLYHPPSSRAEMQSVKKNRSRTIVWTWHKQTARTHTSFVHCNKTKIFAFLLNKQITFFLSLHPFFPKNVLKSLTIFEYFGIVINGLYYKFRLVWLYWGFAYSHILLHLFTIDCWTISGACTSQSILSKMTIPFVGVAVL